MKKHCLFPLLFVATVIFLSLFTNFFLLHRQAEENTVVEVVDGDTFQLKSGKRVRLLRSHYSQVKINLAFGEQWFCSEKEAVNAGFKKAAGCPK